MPALAHDLLYAPAGEARQLALFVHGILGTKANWRGIARKFVKARPEWGAVTVDLPMHGDSQGFEPPWALGSCAVALNELLGGLALPTKLALGHSFGGKVVIELAQGLDSLEQLWIIDSPPGTRADATVTDSHKVIAKLRTLPARFASRAQFATVMAERGLSPAITTWLAMNLRRETGSADASLVFALNLDAIEALLLSYFATDAWDQLARLSEPQRQLGVHLLLGARSQVFEAAEKERLAQWETQGLIDLEVVPDAGHWVHAERPDSVLKALLASTAA